MQRAMAKQAEAEREKRAKVLLAQGEFQAAQTLADAASVISTEPAALQLRYLQTLTEIAAEKNSTIIFPLYAIGEAMKDAMANIKVQAVFPQSTPPAAGNEVPSQPVAPTPPIAPPAVPPPTAPPETIDPNTPR